MEKAETSSAADSSRPWQSYNTVYTNAKAGMDGVDKERVQRVVYEMSKGSKYFKNEEKKEAFMRQKIENMRAECAKLTPADISNYQKLADKRVLELELTRDLSRIWLHVDMDAFYAAVETLSNPSLKGKPMAVGSMSMISTANYEARKFGVRAAMPGFIARKLCPELIFVPTDFKKYTHYSDLTRRVFSRYDPNFMATSLDEAYLEITDVCKEKHMSGEEVAEELRASIFEETGLTCSAGIGPNRLLAKVCSDINKPNGQFVLPNDRMAVMTFISSLPIRKIGGIGKVTECILRDVLGINTCEEMLHRGGYLCALFSQSTAEFFLSVGLGLGGTDTPQVKFRKSISTERTFSATDDEVLLYQKLAEIAEVLCTDMQNEGLLGRTLTLKLKTATFEVRSRALTLQKYICSSDDILKYASKLLKAELPTSLRLIGLRVSHFREEKVGTPSDPAQRTLTNFIVSGDACRNNLSGQNSKSSANDGCLIGETEASISIDSHDACYENMNPLDNNNILDPSDQCHTFSNNDEVEKIQEPLRSNIAAKICIQQKDDPSFSIEENDMDVVRHNPEYYPNELPSLSEAESSKLRLQDGNSPDIVNKEFMNCDAVYSLERKDEQYWLDDYKCSVCGIEMPPNFVEERQEHFDFHLAERLQEEESSIGSRTSILRQRFVQQDRSVIQRKRKKHKASPKAGKDRSIDMFFVKSNQNF